MVRVAAAALALALVACAAPDPDRAWEARTAPIIMTLCEAELERLVGAAVGGTVEMGFVDRAAGLSSLVRGRSDVPHVMTLQATVTDGEGRSALVRARCLVTGQGDDIGGYRLTDLRIAPERGL